MSPISSGKFMSFFFFFLYKPWPHLLPSSYLNIPLVLIPHRQPHLSPRYPTPSLGLSPTLPLSNTTSFPITCTRPSLLLQITSTNFLRPPSPGPHPLCQSVRISFINHHHLAIFSSRVIFLPSSNTASQR